MLHRHNLFNGNWMIEAGYAANYLPLLFAYLKGDAPQSPKQEQPHPLKIHTQSSSFPSSESGDSSDSNSSIAVISISGPITKHSQLCGPTGMLEVSQILEACYASNDIVGIMLHIESGGGDGAAMRLLNQTIADRNKQIIAFIDDFCCSAAYGIASGCDSIVANSNMARIGSIGTYLSLADYTKHFEKEGINIIEVYASASKDKNSEVREALKGNLKPLQVLADKYNENFLSSIETNRGDKLVETRESWGSGNVYFADEALKIGLIDNIDTFQNTLNYFTQ